MSGKDMIQKNDQAKFRSLCVEHDEHGNKPKYLFIS